jgi:hypothetical protein
MQLSTSATESANNGRSFKANFDPKAQVAVLTRFAHRDPSDRKLTHYRSDGLFEAVRRTTAASSDVEN